VPVGPRVLSTIPPSSVTFTCTPCSCERIFNLRAKAGVRRKRRTPAVRSPERQVPGRRVHFLRRSLDSLRLDGHFAKLTHCRISIEGYETPSRPGRRSQHARVDSSDQQPGQHRLQVWMPPDASSLSSALLPCDAHGASSGINRRCNARPKEKRVQALASTRPMRSKPSLARDMRACCYRAGVRRHEQKHRPGARLPWDVRLGVSHSQRAITRNKAPPATSLDDSGVGARRAPWRFNNPSLCSS
jgi:hypothetical protein